MSTLEYLLNLKSDTFIFVFSLSRHLKLYFFVFVNISNQSKNVIKETSTKRMHGVHDICTAPKSNNREKERCYKKCN